MNHCFRLHFLLILIVGITGSACKKIELEKLEEGWMQRVEFKADSKVKAIIKTGDGIENKCQPWSGQGVAVKDKVLYRIYDSGMCQTFDISDLTAPTKIATFALGSNMNSNHANCAQSCLDENGDMLLYVSGLRGGKTYVERMTTTGSTLVQTITLPKMEVLYQSTAFNVVCGDDGYLWLFGSGGDKLLFAKARKPLLSEGDVTLCEDDILDFWYEDGYIYNDDVWQGGKVYNGLLFMLFGITGSVGHLAVYDVLTHKQIMDIDLSDTVREEPEDCEIIPEGILIVVNGGSNYYIVRPE